MADVQEMAKAVELLKLTNSLGWRPQRGAMLNAEFVVTTRDLERFAELVRGQP